MLPFDNRPWARPLARTVIVLSVLGAIVGAYYLYSLDQLHVPEVTGILLALLAVIPPNIAIVRRKTTNEVSASTMATIAPTTGPTTAAIRPTLHSR